MVKYLFKCGRIIIVKSNKDKRNNPWEIAKTKYRFNNYQIEMAKKLGLNPKKFGKLVPNKYEPWKEPLGTFIERCYYKRTKVNINPN